jgi:transcriptional regulator with PAS, ATPase and Fis domain
LRPGAEIYQQVQPPVRAEQEIYIRGNEGTGELPWPGSIRQLKNVIENMVLVSNNEYLQLKTCHGLQALPRIGVKRKEEGLSLQESLDTLNTRY